ncbi:MAG: hypothetical protein MK035_05885 [Dehalococcoidia bacterium]|nr:hypothetical protein [Dehalococcoidia bacterium]
MEKIWDEILTEIDKALKEGREAEVKSFLNELHKIVEKKFGIHHPYSSLFQMPENLFKQS